MNVLKPARREKRAQPGRASQTGLGGQSEVALQPVFLLDSSIAAMVKKCLPAGIVLQAVTFSDDGLRLDLTKPGLEYRQGCDPPGFILGLILAPAAARQDADVLTQLGGLIRDDLLDGCIFHFTEASQAALADWCWRRNGLMTAHLLREYARSHLALAGFRARQEQLERSLAAAEAAFNDFRREPLKLALRSQASGVYVRSPGGTQRGANRIVISQNLSSVFANIIYIDLFFGRDGGGLAGNGRLTVTASGSGAAICDQRFSFEDIRPGWNPFFCSADTLMAKQRLRIELELSAPEALELMPGLANPSPNPDDCAWIGGQASTGRPLALQIWSGIAGISYPRHFNAIAPAMATGMEFETLSVPAERLASAQSYIKQPPDLNFDVISFESETESLFVHPLGRMPTVAKVSGLRVKQLQTVSAFVQLRRPDAQPTDAAIFAVLSNRKPPQFDKMHEPNERISEQFQWLHLKGGEWGEVYYQFPEPVSGDIDVYFITRNTADNSDFAWTFFRGLQLICKT